MDNKKIKKEFKKVGEEIRKLSDLIIEKLKLIPDVNDMVLIRE